MAGVYLRKATKAKEETKGRWPLTGVSGITAEYFSTHIRLAIRWSRKLPGVVTPNHSVYTVLCIMIAYYFHYFHFLQDTEARPSRVRQASFSPAYFFPRKTIISTIYLYYHLILSASHPRHIHVCRPPFSSPHPPPAPSRPPLSYCPSLGGSVLAAGSKYRLSAAAAAAVICKCVWLQYTPTTPLCTAPHSVV